MAINISTKARNDSGNSIVDLIDLGTTNTSGKIELRSGSIPTNPQTSSVDEILATLDLPNPAFGAFVNGTALMTTQIDGTIAKSGVAAWFRIYNRDNTPIIDGSITATGGGGDLQFDTVEWIKGGAISIATIRVNMPQ